MSHGLISGVESINEQNVAGGLGLKLSLLDLNTVPLWHLGKQSYCSRYIVLHVIMRELL